MEEEESLDREVIYQSEVLLARWQVPKKVATEHWILLQKKDHVIQHVREWMCQLAEDKRDLATHLRGKVSELDRQAVSRQEKDLVMSHGLLYMNTPAPNCWDVTLAFVVPAIKRQVAIDGCHRDLGHQG